MAVKYKGRWIARKRTTALRRLLSNTRIDGECLIWKGAHNRGGYGLIALRDPFKHLVYVHRWLYEKFNGPLPSHFDIQLDHLCRNRLCVNLEHLEAVSPRTNTLRGESPSAKNALKIHCPRGHAYDKLDSPDGRRRCNRCCRERYREKQNGLR